MLPISRKCWEDKKTQVLVALSEKGHLTVNSANSTILQFVSEFLAYTTAVLLIPPRPLSRLQGSDQIPETLHVGHTQASPAPSLALQQAPRSWAREAAPGWRGWGGAGCPPPPRTHPPEPVGATAEAHPKAHPNPGWISVQ